MSQAKVDKYKKEKKNRYKTIKKKKIRNFILTMLGVFVVSMGIGYPLGQYLYKLSYEKRLENATIEASYYDYWAQQYISANYGQYFDYGDTSTDSDASEDTSSNVTDDATSTDASSSDATTN